jgi:hypothetical protein
LRVRLLVSIDLHDPRGRLGRVHLPAAQDLGDEPLVELLGRQLVEPQRLGERLGRHLLDSEQLRELAEERSLACVMRPHVDPPSRGRIQTITETKLDVDVQGAVSSKGVGSMRVDHGYAAGDRVEIEPRQLAEVIKPEPPTVLVPKSRRKRYRVGVGDLIELRPDTITELPADSAWQPSRPDVAVRVVEQDQARSVVALDGPAGEVNVALQAPAADGKVRTLCSWKFQIVEKAA